MAKTSVVQIPAGQEEQYNASLNSGSRFLYPRMTKKVALMSTKKKGEIANRSILPTVSAMWAELSDDERADWQSAAEVMGLSGWKLFVQDTTARLANSISGTATPSPLHQSWVGQLHIETPATEIKIEQQHPRFYYTIRKVTGKKGMLTTVKVDELFSIPLELALSYRSNLESTGAGSFARFFARVYSMSAGQTIETILSIDLDLVSDWRQVGASLDDVIGLPIRYDLFFHLYNLRGDLFIDNISAYHSGQNWVRDPYCNDINFTFEKPFDEVPKNWAGVDVPAGAWFDSNYIDP